MPTFRLLAQRMQIRVGLFSRVQHTEFLGEKRLTDDINVHAFSYSSPSASLRLGGCFCCVVVAVVVCLFVCCSCFLFIEKPENSEEVSECSLAQWWHGSAITGMLSRL